VGDPGVVADAAARQAKVERHSGRVPWCGAQALVRLVLAPGSEPSHSGWIASAGEVTARGLADEWSTHSPWAPSTPPPARPGRLRRAPRGRADRCPAHGPARRTMSGSRRAVPIEAGVRPAGRYPRPDSQIPDPTF
jgi:hypothetical protein